MKEVTDAALEALYEEGRAESLKGTIYRTVATFAGLTGRALSVKDNRIPQTDGYEILVPLSDPYAYQHVEHELAHILFESNAVAKEAFITGLLRQIRESFVITGMPQLEEDQTDALKELLSTLIGLLEDARVESLWGLLYVGSAALMKEMHRAYVAPQLKNAQRSLASFLVVAATGSQPPSGSYDRYRPALEEALGKVQRRGFTATLLIAKWLLQKLVDEAVRTRVLAAQALSKGTGAPDTKTLVVSARQRRIALADILRDDHTPSVLSLVADDFKKPEEPSKEESDAGKTMASAALNMKTIPEELEKFLSYSEQKMRDRVEHLRAALSQPLEVDGWITKNTFGKVNLKDITGSKTGADLSAEDLAAVQRLRGLFYRVMGRRKTSLQETGTVIDVAAYIAAKVSNQYGPVFKHDELGRGFKVLVLLDRSLSMEGEKTDQAERACKVLAKALAFPFVEFHVWGFQSIEDTELDLTRFNTTALSFKSKRTRVDGDTPLHLALRVAGRFMGLGTESKQIIVLTDGWPSFTSKHGEVDPRTLSRFVREESRRARHDGVHVTGVVIGGEASMKDDGLNYMFGPNWKRLTPGNLGEGLVQVVASSFLKYLHNG